MRISDWSSDVCSSDLQYMALIRDLGANTVRLSHYNQATPFYDLADREGMILWAELGLVNQTAPKGVKDTPPEMLANAERSEEHTSELQSLMRISYAVFCLKKKKTKKHKTLNKT